MNIIEKMLPGVEKDIKKINNNQYYVKVNDKLVEIEGVIFMNNKEMRFDIKRIKTSREEYIITKQFYKRPNTDSITRVGDIIIVTNLSVETPNRITKHTTNYRVNLEYLFSLPVRSLVTPNRSVYSDISLYHISKYPAYITLETKTERLAANIIEDIEKTILIYSITPHKTKLEYYDVLKPIEIENNISATIHGKGIIKRILSLFRR